MKKFLNSVLEIIIYIVSLIAQVVLLVLFLLISLGELIVDSVKLIIYITSQFFKNKDNVFIKMFASLQLFAKKTLFK